MHAYVGAPGQVTWPNEKARCIFNCVYAAPIIGMLFGIGQLLLCWVGVGVRIRWHHWGSWSARM